MKDNGGFVADAPSTPEQTAGVKLYFPAFRH
jgi:hypothetical protein